MRTPRVAEFAKEVVNKLCWFCCFTEKLFAISLLCGALKTPSGIILRSEFIYRFSLQRRGCNASAVLSSILSHEGVLFVPWSLFFFMHGSSPFFHFEGGIANTVLNLSTEGVGVKTAHYMLELFCFVGDYGCSEHL